MTPFQTNQLNKLSDTKNIKPINNSSISDSAQSNTLGVSQTKSKTESDKTEVKEPKSEKMGKGGKSPISNGEKQKTMDSKEESKVISIYYV
jgi:hypothetical protein